MKKAYKKCERSNCTNLIPWTKTKSGEWTKKSKYEAKKFCSKECKRMALAKKKTVILESVPQPITVYREYSDITVCIKCGSDKLRPLDIGKSCFYCGKIMYAKNANWSMEERRPQELSHLEYFRLNEVSEL